MDDDKGTFLWGVGVQTMGEAVVGGRQRECGKISVPSSHFCSEPKSALKSNFFFFSKNHILVVLG